jgi:predicted nucleotidyltransferase
MQAAQAWAAQLRQRCPEIIRVGLFGSYPRDTYAPGSDLDAVIEVSDAVDARRADRAARYLPDRFPVALDLFVYTSAELERLRARQDPWLKSLDAQVEWLG